MPKRKTKHKMKRKPSKSSTSVPTPAVMLSMIKGKLESYQLNCVVDAHIADANLKPLDEKTRKRVLAKCVTKKAVSASSGSGSDGWLLRGRVVLASGGNCHMFGEASNGSHTHYWLRPVSDCGERINCLVRVEKDKVKLVQWNRNQKVAKWLLNESKLQAGDQCTIHGLVKRPTLNGCIGDVVGDLCADSKRYPLKVVSTGSTHLFKRTNLWRGERVSALPTEGSLEETRMWQRCDLCNSHSANLTQLKAFATKMEFGSAEVIASVQNAMIEIEKRDEVLTEFMSDCGWSVRDNQFLHEGYRKTPMRSKNWYVTEELAALRQMLPENGCLSDGSVVDSSRERLEAVGNALKKQHKEEAIPEHEDDFLGAFSDLFDDDAFGDDCGDLDAIMQQMGLGLSGDVEAEDSSADSGGSDELGQLRSAYRKMSTFPEVVGAMIPMIYQIQRQRVTGDPNYDYMHQTDDDELSGGCGSVPLPAEFYQILLEESGLSPFHEPGKIHAAIAQLFDADTVLNGDDALYRNVQRRCNKATQ